MLDDDYFSVNIDSSLLIDPAEVSYFTGWDTLSTRPLPLDDGEGVLTAIPAAGDNSAPSYHPGGPTREGSSSLIGKGSFAKVYGPFVYGDRTVSLKVFSRGGRRHFERVSQGCLRRVAMVTVPVL